MSELKNFGAILHSRWVRGKGSDKIEGSWAEDFSPFDITVPAQLRDMLVELQNALSDKYNAIRKAEQELENLKRETASFLGKKYISDDSALEQAIEQTKYVYRDQEKKAEEILDYLKAEMFAIKEGN